MMERRLMAKFAVNTPSHSPLSPPSSFPLSLATHLRRSLPPPPL